MHRITNLLFALLLSAQIAHAEMPTELEGVWVVDIPQTITKLQAAGTMDTNGITYMKDRILPAYKRTIEGKQMINQAASGEYTASIDFKEKQGANSITYVTGEIRGNKAEFLLTFIPQSDGTIVMKTQNKADQSDLIVWQKQ